MKNLTFLRFRAAAFVALLVPLLGIARAASLDSLDLKRYDGKVVLVDFWASWCGPCLESFPWMQQMSTRYGPSGLVVVAVNVDHDRPLAERFLRSQRSTFDIVFDPRGAVAESFRVEGMPSSYYIDRHGKVRFTHVGFHSGDAADFEREIALLLSEP